MLVGKVADGHRLIAVRAEATEVDSNTGPVTRLTPLLTKEPAVALGTLVDRDGTARRTRRDHHRFIAAILMACPPAGLPTGRRAVPLTADRHEPGRADRADPCRLVVVTPRRIGGPLVRFAATALNDLLRAVAVERSELTRVTAPTREDIHTLFNASCAWLGTPVLLHPPVTQRHIKAEVTHCVGGVITPPCGTPSLVGANPVPASTMPAFSQPAISSLPGKPSTMART